MTAHLSGPVAVIRSGMTESRPVKRALPLKLWLALEDDVIRHKEEIAQAFAEARARLLPEPAKQSQADLWAAMIRDTNVRELPCWGARGYYYGQPLGFMGL